MGGDVTPQEFAVFVRVLGWCVTVASEEVDLWRTADAELAEDLPWPEPMMQWDFDERWARIMAENTYGGQRYPWGVHAVAYGLRHQAKLTAS